MTGLAALLPVRVSPGTARSTDNSASLTGVVKFEGTAPKPSRIDISADANCAKAHPTPVTTEGIIVGANSGLADGIIYVSDGLGGRTFQPPQQPAVFEQKGCQYKPHVLAMQTNQKLDVVNSDATTHNIHPKSGVEHDSATGSTARTNIHTRGNCNPGEVQYTSWIRGYIAVFKHPYFVVTDTSGSFDLKDLPPGSYTITAWQEKLGTLSQKITVGAGKPRH